MPEYFLVDDGNRMPRWCEFGHAEDRSFWVDFKVRHESRINYCCYRKEVYINKRSQLFR